MLPLLGFFSSLYYISSSLLNLLVNFYLQEQEQALIDAISRLNEISDGESGTFCLTLHYSQDVTWILSLCTLLAFDVKSHQACPF